MKKILYLILLGSASAIAQVNSNQPVVNAIAGQNPFLDASTNFNDVGSVGKGLVFPQTDLTTWTFDTSALDGINFPTAFDGMIVYNTGSGSTLENQGQIVSVTPGFYYFYNPGASDNITNGQWIKFEAGTAGGKFIDGTNPADAVYLTGNVGIGTAVPSQKLTVKGDNNALLIENEAGSSKLAIGNYQTINGTGSALYPQITVSAGGNETINNTMAINAGVGSSSDPNLQGGSVFINGNSGIKASTSIQSFGGAFVRVGGNQNNGAFRREVQSVDMFSDRINLQGRVIIPEIRDYQNSSYKSSAALSFPGVTTAGFLPPKLTTAQIQALAPQSGLMAYNITINCLMYYDGTEWRCDKNGTVFSSTNPNISSMGVTVLPESAFCGDRIISRTGCAGLSGATLNDDAATTLGVEYDWSGGSAIMGQTTRALVEINGQCWFRFNVNVAPSNYPDAPNTGSNIYTASSPRANTYAESNASWGYYNTVTPDFTLGWATAPEFSGEGALYQFTAALNGSNQERAQGICPSGFHVPSDCEVLFLEQSIVGGWNNELELLNNVRLNELGQGNPGTKLRSFGTNHNSDLNRSGFNLLATGYINSLSFLNRTLGYFWTSTSTPSGAIYRGLGGGTRGVSRWNVSQAFGFPVRCIRD
jgi:uncharacterized protein (TIGR02145 family)